MNQAYVSAYKNVKRFQIDEIIIQLDKNVQIDNHIFYCQCSSDFQ